MNTITADRSGTDDSSAKELLISADSHVYFEDDFVKERMTAKIAKLWDEAKVKSAEYNEKVQRQGQKQLAMEDFSRQPVHSL